VVLILGAEMVNLQTSLHKGKKNGNGLVLEIGRENACLDIARQDAQSRGINDENCRFTQFDGTKGNSLS